MLRLVETQVQLSQVGGVGPPAEAREEQLVSDKLQILNVVV